MSLFCFKTDKSSAKNNILRKRIFYNIYNKKIKTTTIRNNLKIKKQTI